MKKIILTLSVFTLTLLTVAQTNSTTVFAVDVRDGFANLRAGASTNYDVVERLPDKRIVFRDPNRAVIGNWTPVVSGIADGWGINHGYMHESVLLPVQEPYASRLANFLPQRCNYTYIHYNRAFLMSFHIPHVFLLHDGECTLVVRDFRAERNFFWSGFPICLSIDFRGDTIRLLKNEYGNPPLVVYRLFRNANGDYDFYTELRTPPRTVPLAEAQQIVADIRQAIVRDLDGDGEAFFMHPQVFKFLSRLVVAYASGVEEARDIIRASSCDASFCHELGFVDAELDAIRRSKLNPNRRIED